MHGRPGGSPCRRWSRVAFSAGCAERTDAVSDVDLDLFLEEQARGMSRAMFLKRTALAGVSSTMLGGFLAACGSSDSGSSAAHSNGGATGGLDKLVSVTP